jgi:hypothetical protein
MAPAYWVDLVYWFDFNTLLQAKCALYLRQALGASTSYLASFVRALAESPDLAAERASVRIVSSPRKGLPAVAIIVAGSESFFAAFETPLVNCQSFQTSKS